MKGFGALLLSSAPLWSVMSGAAAILQFPADYYGGCGSRSKSLTVTVGSQERGISPHVYNDESDVDRFIEAFHRLMPSR
jgi:hypothetical protein